MENFLYNRTTSGLLRALGVATLLAVVGCTRYVKTPAPVDQGSYLVHVVAANGETVRGLTRWYTGSERAVREVANLNSLREGSYLKPGQRILIPSEYVRKMAPPPRQQFSRKAQPKSRKGDVGRDVEEPPIALDASVTNDPTDTAVTPLTDVAAPQPNQIGENTVSVGGVAQSPAATESPASLPAKPSVTPKELTLEDLLQREQTEVNRLKEELESGRPTSSEGAK